MKKNIMLFLTVVMMAFSSVCSAADVPLNEELGPDGLIEAFNNIAIKNNDTTRFVSMEQKDYSNNGEKCFVIKTNANASYNNLLVIYSNAAGYIVEIIDYVVANNNEANMALMHQTLLLQRTISAPEGPETANGMFAAIDALKIGHGMYWSEYTGRRYLLKTVSSNNAIGIDMRAIDQ
jgi:hypothetical protein